MGYAETAVGFANYFQEHVIDRLVQYSSKLAKYYFSFRKSILWSPNVVAVLQANEESLDKKFEHFKIDHKFSIQSALNMLEEAQIVFTRSEKRTHLEATTRLFAMSKQTV